jgi:hypothetical protein
VRNPVDNSPVFREACYEGDNSGKYINWVFVPGDNLSIRLEETNLCLDAGVSPHNNVTAKVYTCYPGLEQQQYVQDMLLLTRRSLSV